MTFPLEIWLCGTPAELDAAVTVLTAAGRTGHAYKRLPLPGDPGRHRLYLQLHIRPTATPPRRPHRTARGRLPVVGDGAPR